MSQRLVFDRLPQSGPHHTMLPGIEIKHYTYDKIRQVRAPQVFADVVWDTGDPDPEEYTIDFYTTEDIDNWSFDTSGYYIPQGTPFVSWRVYRPNPTAPMDKDYGSLRLDKTVGQTVVARYEYTYTRTLLANHNKTYTWTLTQGDTSTVLRTVTVDRTLDPPNMRTLINREVREGTGLIHQVGEIRRWSPEAYTGDQIVERKAGTSGAMDTTVKTYWDPETCAQLQGTDPCVSRNWRVKSLLKRDGSWILRDYGHGYGSYTRPTVEVRPWKDTSKPDDSWLDINDFTGEEGYAATSYEFSLPYPFNEGDNHYFRRPRITTKQADGTVIEKKFFKSAQATVSNGECCARSNELAYTNIESRGASGTSGFDDEANSVTITEYAGHLRHQVWDSQEEICTHYEVYPSRVKSITYPDGRKDTYSYEEGHFTSGDPGEGEKGEFVLGDCNSPCPTIGSCVPGNFSRITIYHGDVNELGYDEKTTVEVLVKDRLDQTYGSFE